MWERTTLMEYILSLVTLMSHLIFILLVHRLLVTLFDWSKIVKNAQDKLGQLRVFLILISIAIGYMVSHFMLEVLSIMQTAMLGQ